jgi:quinol-cytochrome oxidoreductase complex cytochrome b subunit
MRMSNTSQDENNPAFKEVSVFGSRTGWRELKQRLLLEPVKGGSRWTAAFGSLLLFMFVLQIVTGILLVTCYAPSVGTAWQSVKYIQEEAPLGWFIRGMHHWGSSAMVILLLVHLIQVFVWGAYKRPRELTWMTGVLLLAMTLGLAFTGYLLPWDEKAYWASKVGLGIVSTIPVIGQRITLLLQGGPDMGNLTLTRFFALHGFILPGAMIALIVVHLYFFRLHGITTAWWENDDQLQKKTEPFWPGQVWKDGVVALGLLVILTAWVCKYPAPLGDLADPSKAYEARPEWYFMFLFQLLRYFHGPYEIIGTFVLPSLFFCILFFWPLLDRNPSRHPRHRPLALTMLAMGSVGLVGLTIFAMASDVRMTKPEIALQPKAAPAPLQKLDAAGIYASNCLACHGIDGTGSTMRIALATLPDFTSAAWQKSQTDANFTIRIGEGKPPLMPAFKDKLNTDQIQALLGYVRAFAAKAPASTQTVGVGQ